MKIRKIALSVFFISACIALIGVIADSELLLLITKPVIIPSIYFYYRTGVRKPNWVFILFLIFNFIGDTIVLLRFQNPLFTMLPFLISYVIFMKFVIEDALKSKPELSNIGFSALVFAVLMFILSLLLDLHDGNEKLIIPIVVYGFVLSTLVAISAYNYLTFKTISGFYLIVACVCSVVSDVFYILYNLHFHIPVLNYINAAMQLLSYFFFVKYMVNRKHVSSVKTENL